MTVSIHLLHIVFNLFFNGIFSMDGFRVVKLNEVVKNVDVVITCTGMRYYPVTDNKKAINKTEKLIS